MKKVNLTIALQALVSLVFLIACNKEKPTNIKEANPYKVSYADAKTGAINFYTYLNEGKASQITSFEPIIDSISKDTTVFFFK